MTDIATAHRAAAAALTALFQDHRPEDSPTLIAHRIDDVLEALATFSASVALQEIEAHIDAAPTPPPGPAIATTPLPPNVQR